MSYGGGRAVCRIPKSCTPRAVSALCVGYRGDLQPWCSSHQPQHRLQTQLTHTEPLYTLTHDPAGSQHIGTGLDSLPRRLTPKLCRHIPCQAQPSEQWFFSISTTSNIRWPYTTQRPTLIREDKKERFLPFRSSPSLPVTPHFPAHLGNGSSTGHCQVGSSGGKLTLGLFLTSSLCIRLRSIYLSACEFVC